MHAEEMHTLREIWTKQKKQPFLAESQEGNVYRCAAIAPNGQAVGWWVENGELAFFQDNRPVWRLTTDRGNRLFSAWLNPTTGQLHYTMTQNPPQEVGYIRLPKKDIFESDLEE